MTITYSPKPTGFRKWMMDLPVRLYRLRLGWLLGRLVVIVHVGRKSGKLRYTAVETLYRDGETGEYLILSGWGPNSDWCRNLRAAPAQGLWVGTRRYTQLEQRFLDHDEAVAAVQEYARRYPRTARTLAGRIGIPIDRIAEVIDGYPIVALKPV